jgi:hypothetical protein
LFLRHKGLQIQSIDEYHNAVHLTALIGNPDEVTSLNEKVLMVMNSFPEKERHCDLRNLLTSLHSISGKRVKSLADLTTMTRTVTLPSVIAEVLVKYVVPISASAAPFYYLWQIALKAIFHV